MTMLPVYGYMVLVICNQYSLSLPTLPRYLRYGPLSLLCLQTGPGTPASLGTRAVAAPRNRATRRLGYSTVQHSTATKQLPPLQDWQHSKRRKKKRTWWSLGPVRLQPPPTGSFRVSRPPERQLQVQSSNLAAPCLLVSTVSPR